MGSICSCLCLEDLEEYRDSDAFMDRYCSSLRCLTQQLLHAYSRFLQREEVRSVPLVEQGMDSSASTVDNPIADVYCSPPRPLPYDDPRCSCMQHDRLISRHDKSSSQFHEESEPLRGMEMSTTTKCSRSNYEAASKFCCLKSSLKNILADVPNEGTCTFPSYECEDEDEDVCPTCLEEYTYENPRIVTKCFHHYHLSCIYEWKERSDLCPVCGKELVFDEI